MLQQYYISRISILITLALSLATTAMYLDEKQNDSENTTAILRSISIFLFFLTMTLNLIGMPTYNGKEIRTLSAKSNWLNGVPTDKDTTCCGRGIRNLEPGFYALFSRKKSPTSSVPSMVTTLNEDGLDERLLR